MTSQESNSGVNPSQIGEKAGSLETSGPAFLVIGKLRRSHGVRGEIVMEVFTDFPERIRKGVVVYIGEEHLPKRIRSRRPHIEGLLIGLDGITTPEEAGSHRNLFVYVRTNDRPKLDEGEFYHHQILGMRVVSDEGEQLGILREILETGANDVFLVETSNHREILIPGTPEFVKEINVGKGEILVHLIPGVMSND